MQESVCMPKKQNLLYDWTLNSLFAIVMMPNMKDFIFTSCFDSNMRTLEATTIHSYIDDLPHNPL